MKLSLMMLLLAALAVESFSKILVKPRDCIGNFKKMKDDMKEKKMKGKVGKTFDRLCIATLEDTTVEEAERLLNVVWAEPDYVVTIAAKGGKAKTTTQAPNAVTTAPTATTAPPPTATTDSNCVEHNNPGNWNADRCDQRDKLSYNNTLAPNSTYMCHPATDGTGVSVAVIDTGVDIDHPDFENRAVHKYSADGATAGAGDINGHGTHVAGIIGSSTHGIAKNVTILAYRCLDDTGSNLISELIGCIEKAVEDKAQVISMSIGTNTTSTAFNDAVQSAVDSGIPVVVSAGNEGGDACKRSPASASAAITVGATNIHDSLSSFSNYGNCVDILAPGGGIISTYPNGEYRKRSGTSMATPAVSGAIARMISDSTLSPPLTPAQIWNKLKDVASADKINGLEGAGPEGAKRKKTPNLLLYIPCKF